MESYTSHFDFTNRQMSPEITKLEFSYIWKQQVLARRIFFPSFYMLRKLVSWRDLNNNDAENSKLYCCYCAYFERVRPKKSKITWESVEFWKQRQYVSNIQFTSDQQWHSWRKFNSLIYHWYISKFQGSFKKSYMCGNFPHPNTLIPFYLLQDITFIYQNTVCSLFLLETRNIYMSILHSRNVFLLIPVFGNQCTILQPKPN